MDDRVSLARADLVKGMLKWSVLFGDNNDDAPMVKYVLVNLGRMWTPASEIVGLYIYITISKRIKEYIRRLKWDEKLEKNY